MAANPKQKFFEVIRPGTKIEFIGTQKYWIGASIILILISVVMPLLNAFVLKDRGHALNWGVDFRGGTEMVIDFSRAVDPGDLRRVMAEAGFENVDVVKFADPSGKSPNMFMLRMGAVSVVSAEQAKHAREALSHVGEANLKRFDWSEGGDKIYLRFDRPVEIATLGNSLGSVGVKTTQVQAFGRADENSYEATLISLDAEVRRAIDSRLGEGTVAKIPQVDSVGAKAGEQLRFDGARSLIYAILLIMVYIFFRFDFRYAPGTVVALLHDAIIVVGAFAVTYKEFSLTTVAAILTIIGFSMNDTVVVFDRIRENEGRWRDRKIDRVVNQSVNETLSRTILTSATVFFVTLAMNIWGTGVIRDFAFAMNVGIIVGTYSSIFIASPVLIWLHERARRGQQKQGAQKKRQDEDLEPEPAAP